MHQRMEFPPTVVVGIEKEGLEEEQQDVREKSRREHAHHVVRELRIQDDEHERQRRAERRGQRERHRQQLGELVREPVVSQVAGLVADRFDDEREDGDGEDERREEQMQLRDHPDGDAAPDPRNGPVLRFLVGFRRSLLGGGRRWQGLLLPTGWRLGGRGGGRSRGRGRGGGLGRLLGHAARQRRGHRDRPHEHREAGHGTQQDQQRTSGHHGSVRYGPQAPPLARTGAYRSSAPSLGGHCSPIGARGLVSGTRTENPNRCWCCRKEAWLPAVVATDGRLVHQVGPIWTMSQTPGTLEDRCPDRDFAMERLTASVRPQEPAQRERPRFDPDPVE
jgi:hypothetical protein